MNATSPVVSMWEQSSTACDVWAWEFKNDTGKYWEVLSRDEGMGMSHCNRVVLCSQLLFAQLEQSLLLLDNCFLSQR